MATRKKGAAPRPKSRDAWRVAVHEAGHAIAAHALGLPLGDVTIVPGSTADGDGYAGLTALGHDPGDVLRALDEYYDLENDDDDRQEKSLFFLIQNMQVSFAGMIAEELFFGAADESGLGPDYEAIGMCTERLCPPDAQELRKRGMALSSDVTMEEVQVLADELADKVPKQEEEYLRDWLKHRTRKLLRTRRDLVEALALELKRRETLKPEEVVKTILDAMRQRWRVRTPTPRR